MAVDEGQGLVGKKIGRVAVKLLQLAAPINQVLRVRGAEFGFRVFVQQEIVTAHEEAEIVIESARLRVMGGAEALMPFADQPRGIAGRAKVIGDRLLIERQAQLAFIALVWIEFMTKASLISPGEKAGAGGTAVRC